jgi:hypothetical protein
VRIVSISEPGISVPFNCILVSRVACAATLDSWTADFAVPYASAGPVLPYTSMIHLLILAIDRSR